jgi:hypothetical protein
MVTQALTCCDPLMPADGRFGPSLDGRTAGITPLVARAAFIGRHLRYRMSEVERCNEQASQRSEDSPRRHEKELMRFARRLNGHKREASKTPASPCLRGGIHASLACLRCSEYLQMRKVLPSREPGESNQNLCATEPVPVENLAHPLIGLPLATRPMTHAQPEVLDDRRVRYAFARRPR